VPSLDPNFSKQGYKCLVIEKTHLCRVYEKSLETNDMIGLSLPIFFVIGIISIDKFIFTCVVTEK
jgi:hypothetical protein